MKITGAIFDLDGTLVDSMPMWHNFVHDFLTRFGVTPPENLSEQVMTMNVKTSSQYIHDKFLPDNTPEQIEKDIEDMVWDAYANTIPIKHGVKPFLFALRCKGVRMCIATASPRALAEVILKRLNIDHYFSVILTCSELNTSKEESLIYDRAFDILGTGKETTYIFEDAIHGIRTAKAAGYKVIAVKEDMSAAHLDEIKELSDIYIKDFDDFRGMIR